MLFAIGVASPAFAQYTLTTLANFSGRNGAYPQGDLTIIGNTLYGTTVTGGDLSLSGGEGDGTVFSLPITGGAPTTLATFNGSNGQSPYAGLTVVGNTFYGTTDAGGAYGDGAVFSVSVTGGAPTALASFNGDNGQGPNCGLTLVGSTLYGTTMRGGANDDGTIFSVSISGGAPTTLATFDGSNGAVPATLTLVGSTLYGATAYGGANNHGTVFSVPIAGGAPTPLGSFNVGSGYGSQAAVTIVGNTIYGTTDAGGAYGDGTVFSMPITGGTPTALVNFNRSNGDYSTADLTVVGSTLYGTTFFGGNLSLNDGYGLGTVFSVPITGGASSTLAAFNGSDGETPVGGLAVVGKTLYGTTWAGGANNDGTVFELSPRITWNNAGGAGDGGTWDTAGNQNWNDGAAPAFFQSGDNITFNDSNAGNYAVALNSAVSPGSVTVNNSSDNYVISGTGSIADCGAFLKSGSGTLTLGTGLSVGSMSINGGTLKLAANTTLGSGTVTSNVILTSLSITGNGVLDVNNNHIIITYGSSDPITAIAGYIASGYNGGGWNGPGIISSAAQTTVNGLSYGLGYADGADGVVSGLSSGQIEVMYTLLGDANLDGYVNGEDFTILAANFNQPATGWDQGDFNYDGQVNGEDFSLLAANFNQGVSGAASAGDVAALDAFAAANGLPLPTQADVPEPASMGFIALAAMGMLNRRSRRPDKLRGWN
jgi:uncharacterized repeat protein (TIGR03803 family)